MDIRIALPSLPAWLHGPRPRTTLCRACGDNTGRQRRSNDRKGKRTETPRKLYRYAATGELAGKDFVLSFNRGYGEQVMLTASAGRLDTTDAEIAKYLDARPDLLRST